MAQESAEKPTRPRSRLGCLVGAGLLVLIVIIAVMALSGPAPETPSGPASSPSAPAAPTSGPIEKKPDLELIEAHSETEGYVRYVVGTIRNNTKREYKYVQVEINLYDKSGAQVGSTLANTNNLEPGGVWKFKAVILQDEATSFKVKDITGW